MMNKGARQQLGKAGEEMAARLLIQEGMVILDHNWRCPYGELDLVASESAPDASNGGVMTTWLVAVEVRIRRGTRFGTAKESVTATKQAKLRTVAQAYVQASGWQGPWRIDVVAIQLDGQGRMIEQAHLRHAVTG
jgi:putative endonuclease